MKRVQGQIQDASRKGFVSGAASAFNIRGRGKPAPPSIRRSLGSLREDARAIQRDGERLFHRA